jgi:ankyrin repeat protein
LAAGGELEQFDLDCLKNDPEAISKLWIERTASNPNQLDADGKTLLQAALNTSNLDVVRLALEHGVDPNAGDPKDYRGDKRESPLAIAVLRGDSETAQLLIDQGADLTHQWTEEYDIGFSSENRPFNALTLALERGDLAMVELLLDAGMSYSGKGSIGLAQMAETNDFELLDKLIAAGFDLNEGDTNLPPPLEQAIEQNNTALVKFLLERGATISENRRAVVVSSSQSEIIALLSAPPAQTTEGSAKPNSQVDTEQSPQSNNDELLRAIQNNIIAQVTAELDGGADVNQVGSNGYTPLTMAAAFGSNQIIQMLLSRGAQVNQIDGRGVTPLSMAASLSKRSSQVELLLSQGAQIDQLDGDDLTPLMRTHSKDMIDLLIAKGANVNQTNGAGKNVLAIALSQNPENIDHLLAKGARFNPNDPLTMVYAVRQNNFPLLNTSIQQRANPNQRVLITRDGRSSEYTPLIEAINLQRHNMTLALLENGAQVNFPDSRGTPLTAAINRQQWDIVDRLLKEGANYNQAAPDGQTPLNQAIRENNTQLVEQLLELGTDPNQQGTAPDQQGVDQQTPLTAVIRHIPAEAKPQLVRLLLRRGAEVTASTLSLAIRNDDVEIVQLLLAGVDVNVPMDGQQTSLSTAIRYSSPEMAQLLFDQGADPNWRGPNNMRLMDLAFERGSLEIVSFLRSNGIE